MIKESRGHSSADYSLNKIASSESSNSFDESLVKLRIKCVPKNKDVQYQDYSEQPVIKLDKKLTTTTRCHKEDDTQKSDGTYHKHNCFNTESHLIKHSQSKSRQNVSRCLTKDSHFTDRYKHDAKVEEQVKPVVSIHKYPASEAISSDYSTRPRSKSAASEPIGSARMQSASSARSSVNSAQKSC